MTENLILNQKNINNNILKLINNAEKYIIWFSMLTQFSNNKLNEAIIKLKKKLR